MHKTRSQGLEDFYGAVITTAVEGGTNYWAMVEEYQYVYNGEVCIVVGPQRRGGRTRAVLVDMEDGSTFTVTPDSMAQAFGLLASTKDQLPKYVTGAWARRMLAAYRERDAGEIDSSDADNLVQLACFGEVVYG